MQLQRVEAHYREFWRRGIPVDVVNEESDLSRYKLVVAPMLLQVRKGVGERIGAFVEAGGTFVTTYQSGVVDDSDLCHLGGFPGPLKGVLGVWAEETDVFWDIHTQSIRALDGDDLGLCGTYAVEDYADILHLEGAEALAEYAEDFYAGSPALTRNRCGDGEGYYIASRNDTRFLSDFYGGLAERIGLRRVLPVDLPEGVSAVERADEKNRFVFVMNFNPDGVEVPLGGGAYRNLLADGAGVKNAVRLDGYGVAVLQEA
jgi:beta-galactosidase